MDFFLETDRSSGNVAMSFNAVNDIRNNIILSLITKKGSFFLNPDFGSRLHEVTSTSPESVNLIKSYCKEAVSWMLQAGKLVSFDVTAVPSVQGVNVSCVAVLPDGKTEEYSTFLRVL